MPEEKQLQQRIAQIDALIARLDQTGDPELKACARELVQLIMEFHGAGLERMMKIVSQAGEAGQRISDRFDRDNLVRSILLLYGLHPLDFERRVREGVEKAGSALRSHGASVELVSVVNGEIRLRLSGGKGCGSAGIRAALEEAIYEAAPDLTRLSIEEAETDSSTFLPLSSLLRQPASAGRGSGQP